MKNEAGKRTGEYSKGMKVDLFQQLVARTSYFISEIQQIHYIKGITD